MRGEAQGWMFQRKDNKVRTERKVLGVVKVGGSAFCRSADGSSAYSKAVDERVETPIGPIPPLTLRG